MRGRGVAQCQIASLALRIAREVARARAAPVVPERCVDDPIAEPTLADRQRQILVVAVVEAIPLVEAADLFDDAPAQTHADGVDDDDVFAGRLHGRALGEAVHDRAPDEPSVPTEALDSVETRHADAGIAERVDELREPGGVRQLGVVVEETEELRLHRRPGAVERRDHGGVVVALDEMERIRVRKRAEELAAAIPRAIVDDDEAKGLRRRAEAVEQAARERELVEDRDDEAEPFAHVQTRGGGGASSPVTYSITASRHGRGGIPSASSARQRTTSERGRGADCGNSVEATGITSTSAAPSASRTTRAMS